MVPAYEWKFQTGQDGKTIITTKEADGLAVLIEWVRDGLTTPTDIGKEMGLSTGQVSKMANRSIEAGNEDPKACGLLCRIGNKVESQHLKKPNFSKPFPFPQSDGKMTE